MRGYGTIMKNEDGIIYYNVRETSYHLNISHTTLRNWIRINQELINQGKQAIIPTPTNIKNILHFSQQDIRVIKENMRHFRRGDFKKFNKKVTTYDKLKEENSQLRGKISEIIGGVNNERD